MRFQEKVLLHYRDDNANDDPAILASGGVVLDLSWPVGPKSRRTI